MQLRFREDTNILGPSDEGRSILGGASAWVLEHSVGDKRDADRRCNGNDYLGYQIVSSYAEVFQHMGYNRRIF